MKNNRAQAAMEFLTTYGWAFLIIIVAVAGLAYFGVFDTSRFMTTGGQLDGMLALGDSYAISNDTNFLMINLINNEMQEITLDSVTFYEKNLEPINCTANVSTISIPSGHNKDIKINDTAYDLQACGIEDNINKKKTFIINVDYSLAGSDIIKRSSGTLTGNIQ